MNSKVVVTAVAAFVLGTITTGVMISWAQPAGPPGAPPALSGPPPMAGGPWMARGQGQFGDRMREHFARRREMMRVFSLVYRADDRHLTPPDVQKIVEGFLLWNGNHTWKVMNVKADGDAIAFDLATGDGSVIAHYTMDPKTGRPTRKG
ncbi:MAG: hypothetical protein ABSA58_01580 [Acetobacteraceae bacterium]